jgi:hypothetical protein
LEGIRALVESAPFAADWRGPEWEIAQINYRHA